MFGLFGIFSELGLGNALSKFIPEFIVKKQYSKIKSSFVSVSTINFLIALFIGLVFITFSKNIGAKLFSYTDAWKLIVLFAVYFILNPVLIALRASFRGFFKMGYYALVDISQASFLLFGSLILILLGFNIFSLFLSYALFAILGTFIFYQIFVKKIFDEYKQIKFKFDPGLTKKLLKFGVFIAIANAFGVIFGRIDTFLLSYLASLKEAAYFQVAFPLARAVWDIGAVISVVLLPIISEMWAKNHLNKFNQEIEKLYTYTLLILLPICSVLFSLSEPLVVLLYGKKYLLASYSLKIMAFAVLVKAITKINNVILIGVGHPERLMKFVIVGSIVNILLNLILIPKYGSVGAAFSLLISFIIILIYTMYETVKLTHFKIHLSQMLKIGFVCSLFFTLNLLMQKILQLSYWINIFFSLSISLIIYILLIFHLKIITFKEIKTLINLSRK